MKIEFDITLTGRDIYRFSMYHAYTGHQGAVSILSAVICFVMAFYAFGSQDVMRVLLCAGFGILMLAYLPVSLSMRSKQQIMKSEVLKNTLHYTADDAGIHTSQNGASADLPWEAVYRIVSAGSNLLVYSSRINAFILPKSQIQKEYDTLCELAKSHLPKYRYKI